MISPMLGFQWNPSSITDNVINSELQLFPNSSTSVKQQEDDA
jgi:hypothetical protein